MSNIFALCLIVSSLTAAGLWSPSPLSKKQEEDVIVKEGHRVVVVEYGGDQGQHVNTKVSISSSSGEEEDSHHRTRDLICDAFGKCKHKIASAVDKAKLKLEVGSEAVADAFDEAKDTVSEKGHRLKDTVLEKARDLKEGAEETLEAAGEDVMEKGRREADKIKLKEKNLMAFINDSFLIKRSYLDQAVKAAADVLGLLGFGLALGMGVWTTFISSYVLASVLPRQQLAVVQSKIYPVYFRAMASSIGMALFGHLFSRPTNAHLQGYVLLAALFMLFANSLYIEPRATKVMFERLKMEKEEGRGIMEDIAAAETGHQPPAMTTATQVEVVKSRMAGLNKRLKKLNSCSSLLNLLTLMALTSHLLYLTHRLRLPCSSS